jgi:hypothetical protein
MDGTDAYDRCVVTPTTVAEAIHKRFVLQVDVTQARNDHFRVGAFKQNASRPYRGVCQCQM